MREGKDVKIAAKEAGSKDKCRTCDEARIWADRQGRRPAMLLGLMIAGLGADWAGVDV